MIARIEFADGIELPRNPETLHHDIGGLLLANIDYSEILTPGAYDITPAIWTKHASNHELVVFDNGEGLYRMFPRYQDVGFIESDDTGKMSAFRRGGRQQPLNEDQPLAVVAGGHPTKRTLQIYNLLAYLPQ